MSSDSSSPQAMESPFIKELVRQWRSLDTNGAWDGKSDEELLSRYILTRERRKQLPLIADPDPPTIQRVEIFYNAVGLAVEKQTGIMVAPLMKMHHEGFGRMVLIGGRLVVISKNFRDLHRFGFETMDRLAEEGEKLVAEAVEMIRLFPEVAEYG